ncbi:HMA2 domain-containing protein [Helicobacter sp. WB40]|uniref:HMA2 domain-containing protein n=1 Tax=Helicobacter sp. WB40 TaxID=3004130 RepID=UPI0022EBD7C0|nr:hypothetical protein [Helicobacter sp. WB40]MDA3967488.1 hypothetical protein [Helicobacter sp. WB40]
MKQITKEDIKNYKITSDDLRFISKYFSIIHHSKGRIRLRASLSLKGAISDSQINIDSILETIKSIPAILEFKFNKLIGSITILYDNNILHSNFWDEWINGENLEKIADIINEFKKEI